MNDYMIEHEGRSYLIEWRKSSTGRILIAGIINAAGIRLPIHEAQSITKHAASSLRAIFQQNQQSPQPTKK